MTLLLAVIQARAMMILEQTMPCAEVTAAEAAVAHDALYGFPTGGARRGTRAGDVKAAADAFATGGSAT